MKRTVATVALALAVTALVTAGCGGSDDGDETSATTEWASGLCTAISTWTSALTSSAESLEGGNISESSLESAAADAKSATEAFADDVQALGKPDTEAGERANDLVDQLSRDLEQGVDEIESAVDDISGVSGVLNAVSTATSTLATMSSQVSSTLDELRQLDGGEELEDAFQQATSCQELSG